MTEAEYNLVTDTIPVPHTDLHHLPETPHQRLAYTYRASRRNAYFGRDYEYPFPANYSPYANLRRQRKFLARQPLDYIPPNVAQTGAIFDRTPVQNGPRSRWPGARKPHANPSAPYGSLFRIAPMPN